MSVESYGESPGKFDSRILIGKLLVGGLGVPEAGEGNEEPICIYIYIYVYVCIYVYIYIHITCIHTCICEVAT